MARSTVIYVVIDLADHGLPCAGFTIKHQLQKWHDERDTSSYKFFRVQDGLSQDPKVTEVFYPFDKTK